MKDLTPSAWEGFVATHRPGDMVRGKVTRFTSFGVFVELGEGLEGLCHISELSDERVEKPEDIVQLGQEIDSRSFEIEKREQKIGLSYRAVGKEDELVVDTRQFSSDAKSGMASLGELANLMKPEGEVEAKPELSREEKDEAKRIKKEQARKEYEEAAAREAAASSEAPAVETGSEDTAAISAADAEAVPESTQETSAEPAAAEVSEAEPNESPAPETSAESDQPVESAADENATESELKAEAEHTSA